MTSSRPPWTAHLDLYGNPECDYHAQVTIGSTLVIKQRNMYSEVLIKNR
jgi:hypothetical protein